MAFNNIGPELHIQGARTLSAQLSALGAIAGGKAARAAAVNAVKPAVAAARANAPVSDRNYLKKTYKGRPVAPGFLKRNIIARSTIAKDKRTIRVSIGPRKEAFYGTQFIEVGTSTIAKQPWLEPAFRSNKEVMIRNLSKALEKQIKKAAAKQ